MDHIAYRKYQITTGFPCPVVSRVQDPPPKRTRGITWRQTIETQKHPDVYARNNCTRAKSNGRAENRTGETVDEGCATSHRLKWGPFSPNEGGIIAELVRKGKERKEGEDLQDSNVAKDRLVGLVVSMSDY